MANINLHLGDCMEAMAGMKDNHFDLAICDPPYGIGAEKGTGDYSKAVSPKNKKWDTPPLPNYFREVFRVSNNQIIWGANYFHFLPIKRCWFCWYKTDEVKGRDFSEFELAWSSFNSPARHISIKPFIRNGNRIHHTQKPVALYRWLLDNYAKPGDRILDTHLGSGSIAIACHDLGFDLEGYEIDKDYYTAACDRLKRHQAQLTLF